MNTLEGSCRKGHPRREYSRIRPNGRVICRECTLIQNRVWRKKNLKQAQAYARKWYADNPTCAKQTHLLRYFGMTLAEWDIMYAAQDGKCAVCGEYPRRELGVDHDHKTGRVRALLCRACNLKIGVLEHSLLPKLVAYLEEHQ